MNPHCKPEAVWGPSQVDNDNPYTNRAMSPYVSVTSTAGPVRFIALVWFLAHKAEGKARRNLRQFYSSCHIRLRAPQGLTRLRIMFWSNTSQDSTGTHCDAPLRSQHGLFAGCLCCLNQYEARKLIMHALKLYESVRGGKIRTRRTISQSVISPYGIRECDVTGVLVKRGLSNAPVTSHS